MSQRRADGHLRWWGGGELPRVWNYDPETRTLETVPPGNGYAPCIGAACRSIVGITRDLGESFDSYTQVEDTAPYACRLHWDRVKGGTQRCVPRRPTRPRSRSPAIATSATRCRSGVARCSRGMTVGRFNRSRFAEFEYLPSPDVTEDGRLVRLGPDGPEEVHFRTSPCVDNSGCGYEGSPDYGIGQIQWIHALGDGDYLVFYTVQQTNNDNQQTLYMGHDRPTFTPITPSGPLPLSTAPSTDVAPLNTLAMTPLQSACIAYASCVGDPTLYATCLAHYALFSPARPGMAAARARLIAAKECPALMAAWPEGVGMSSPCPSLCLESGGSCDAETGACSTLVPDGDLAKCGQCDADNKILLCNDTQQFAATCLGAAWCRAPQPETATRVDAQTMDRRARAMAAGAAGRGPRKSPPSRTARCRAAPASVPRSIRRGGNASVTMSPSRASRRPSAGSAVGPSS